MRIGLVGCGKIGARHLDALRSFDDVQVILTDRDDAVAQEMARRWDVTSVPQDALLGEALDALDVCVPTPLHKQWICAGLEAGLHVFCEKPLCLSATEACEIRDVARRAERMVMVGYLYRHHPAFRFAKETVDHGMIGRPHFALARLGGRGSHRAWKHDSENGGGVVFEMMVHMLDLLSWLLGPLDEGRLIYRRLLLPTRTVDGEDVVATAPDCAIVELTAGGVDAVCESDLATPSFMNYVEIQGSNGSLAASILEYMPTVVYCNEPRGLFDRGHNFRRFGPTNLFVKELGAFVERLRSGEFDEWSLLESIELARFIDGLEGADVAARA